MAGGAQGGGAKPVQAGQPQFNPQAAQQFQQALQNYRQGTLGMPSQVSGANVAAPGGGMPMQGGQQFTPPPPASNQLIPAGGMGVQGGPQFNPNMGAPQQMQPAYAGLALGAPQGQGMVNTAVMPQNEVVQRPIPRPMPMPQVQGNPNAMPLQRPQRFNPGMTMGRKPNG